jgi:tight adherence protein C
MSDSLAVVALLVCACAGLIVFALLSSLFSEERKVARRLRSMTDVERKQVAELEVLAKPFSSRVIGTAGNRLAAGVRALMPSAYLARVTTRIRLSGPRWRLTAELFILWKAGLGAVGLVVGPAIGRAAFGNPLWEFSAGAIGVFLGFFGPDAWLSGRVAARQKALRIALPDMLDMLMVSVEAGLGFDASLLKVVTSTSGPLSEEFGILLQEIQAGQPRRDALQHLAARTDLPELSAFILAIVQADTFGVSIANTLRQQAKEMRTRRRQRAEELAQAAPAKMVFPIILCILPATLIAVGGPAIIRIARAFGVPL